MKRFVLSFLALQLLVASTARATGWLPDRDPVFQSGAQPPTLESLLSPTSEAVTGVPSIRAQLLMEGGRTVGFQGGLSSRGHELVAGLHRRQRALDLQYEFGSLISTAGVLPPVIVEARDVAAFSSDQIRTANRVYKIEREERFVSMPPTWRDYLLIGLPLTISVELPVMEARPVDSAEMKIWQEAVRQGWREGAEQAEAILQANFNRLTRDYSGMVLYSTLVQHGMIGTSTVTDQIQTVTGTSNEITLGDRIKRLTGRAGFEIDPGRWRPKIKVGPLPPPLPQPAAAELPATPAKTLVPPPSKPLGSAPSQQGLASEAKKRPVLRTSPTPTVVPGAIVARKPVPAETKAPPAVTTVAAPVPLARTEKVEQKPSPVPAKPKEIWVTGAGSTLRETVLAWARKAGWHVDWQAEDLDYGISAPLRFEGSFEEAIGQLFALYAHAQRPMDVPASRSQKLLRVQETTPVSNQLTSRKRS